MAAIHNKGKSCLDVLSASGYVWGATDGEAGESRVAREESPRTAELLNAMPFGIFMLR